MIRRRAADQPQWQGEPLNAVLFDLDGTLLDTAADIGEALNRALAECQLGSFAPQHVREMVGRGAPKLIASAVAHLDASMNASRQAALLERYFFHYNHLHVFNECSARVYPGAAQCLGELCKLGMRLAVVTNTQQHFATGLLQRLGLSEWIQVVVGGDTCEHRKPDPQPLLFACEALDVPPAHALMVGDSVNDVLAARAAGLPVVCVPYGYNEGEDPRQLACDAFVETLADLPALLTGARPAKELRRLTRSFNPTHSRT